MQVKVDPAGIEYHTSMVPVTKILFVDPAGIEPATKRL